MFARPYQPADLEPLCAFVARCHQLSAVPDKFMHPGDLVWRTLQHAHYQPQQELYLWEMGGETSGFVLQKRLSFDFVVAPWLAPKQQRGLLAAMLAHVEGQTRERGLEGNLLTSVSQGDLESTLVLQAAGFVRDDDLMYALERPLTGEMPTPTLPEGFVVRHPKPHELGERVEIHQMAPGVSTPSRARIPPTTPPNRIPMWAAVLANTGPGKIRHSAVVSRNSRSSIQCRFSTIAW